MARASYSYVLLGEEGIPVGAFTVKYELRRLLTRMQETSPGVLAGLRLFRVPDGYAGRIAELNIADVISGN
jgi:hypothetical protein